MDRTSDNMMHMFTNMKKTIISGFLLIFSATLLVGLLPSRASAATMGAEFVNAANWRLRSLVFTQSDITNDVLDSDLVSRLGSSGITIINDLIREQVGNKNFFDRNARDPEPEYVLSENGCDSVFRHQESNWKLVNLRLNISGEGCVDIIEKDLIYNQNNPNDSNALNTLFEYVNQNTIKRVDDIDGNFVVIDTNLPNRFVSMDAEGKPTQAYFEMNSGRASGTYYRNGESQGSFNVGNVDARIRPPTTVNSDGTIAVGTNTENSTESGGPTCESEGGEFSFFLCPVLRLADDVIIWVDGNISDFLNLESAYYENTGVQGAWARVRNIAYILLIPIMLVMVIGTALGFQFLDAYTVKRALPRMFIAIIFMALSFDLLAIFINTVNVVGQGIGGLIAQPFGGLDNLTLANTFNSNAGTDVAALGVGVLAGVTAAAVGAFSLGILASYLLIAAIAIFIVFVILAVRELLLVFLMILSPIAILAWIFPGNDKAWKFWWGTFSKLLILYPVIMALLVVGRAFAGVIQSTPGADGIVVTILKLTAYIGPFFFIPSMFRWAGGFFANIAGRVNDTSKGIFDRNRKYRSAQRKQNWERDGKRRLTQTRADYQSRLQSQASKGGFMRRNTLGRLASVGSRTVGGYNIQAQDSEQRERVSKELNAQIATGRDDEIRGLTVNKRAALQGIEGEDWRIEKGTRQFKSLGGMWVDEAAVDAGYRRWGNDTYAQQAALSYEMRKAMTSEQVQRINDKYASVAVGAGGWRQTKNQAQGTWIGSAFENQNQHLEFKNSSLDLDQKPDGTYGSAKLNAAKFADEMYEKKGSYQISQMSGHTIDQLYNAYEEAERDNDKATMDKIAAVSEVFVQRGGQMQPGVAPIGKDGDLQPVQQLRPPQAGQQATSPEYAVTYGQGAASVNEKINRLAQRTGRLNSRPANPHPMPDSRQN